jgi:hypothetical protein
MIGSSTTRARAAMLRDWLGDRGAGGGGKIGELGWSKLCCKVTISFFSLT